MACCESQICSQPFSSAHERLVRLVVCQFNTLGGKTAKNLSNETGNLFKVCNCVNKAMDFFFFNNSHVKLGG